MIEFTKTWAMYYRLYRRRCALGRTASLNRAWRLARIIS